MSRTVHCTICDAWVPLEGVLDHMELEHRDKLDPRASRFVVIVDPEAEHSTITDE